MNRVFTTPNYFPHSFHADRTKDSMRQAFFRKNYIDNAFHTPRLAALWLIAITVKDTVPRRLSDEISAS